MRRIRQELVPEKTRISWAGWRTLVRIPGTIYATALAMVILVSAFIVYHPAATREGGSLSGESDMVYDYLLEQSSEFSNGNGDSGEQSGNDHSQYGTLVEEYLM
jgi:hypothetical protein